MYVVMYANQNKCLVRWATFHPAPPLNAGRLVTTRSDTSTRSESTDDE